MAASPSFKLPRSQTSVSSSSHAAMVDLKSRVLSSLSKLSDRDTHQIAVEDLDRIIRTLQPEFVPMLVNALTHEPPCPAVDASSKHAPPPAVARREPLRLLASLASAHPDAAAAQLSKILSHIARRLKDPLSDSSVREACRDSVGSLAVLYLRPLASVEPPAVSDDGGGGNSPVVGLFMKPLLEVMGEQSKVVQAGAAACVAKAVECAGSGPGAVAMFGRLCPRVCKLIAGQNVLAKGALLGVIASLAQVGAISPQNMQLILQNIRGCLENSDWATRKAAADTLYMISTHCSNLIGDGATQTVAALEASRFDKIKPVRDSVMEALQSWKNVIGEETRQDNPKDGKIHDNNDEEKDSKASNGGSGKEDSLCINQTDRSPSLKVKGGNLPEKAAVLMMKRTPTLTDKGLNTEFFQKLETRNSDAVEVVVPRKLIKSQLNGENGKPVGNLENLTDENSQNRTGSSNVAPSVDDTDLDSSAAQGGLRIRENKTKAIDDEERSLQNSSPQVGFPRSDASVDSSSMNNKSNLLAIQRQLSQLERQQTSLMNMLQDFMGGSHDSMITLENRVRGLEGIVEEMARDLSASSSRRGGNPMTGFDSSPGRSSSRYNVPPEYEKFGRSNDSRVNFSDRFFPSEAMTSNVRRDPWRSYSDSRDSYAYSATRNGMNNWRGLSSMSADERISRTERFTDQLGTRRAWDKGHGQFRLGEGPSARSAWQASKDEATLEAIRVAGEDNESSVVSSRLAVAELDGEALENNNHDERGPLWELWSRAMDSLHVGDMESAYALVLSTDDALLLVKLMEQTGPVIDQLSSETGNEVLRSVGQLLMEDNYYDMALSWLQQFTDLVLDNGPDFLDIPMNGKKEILLNLRESCAADLPEDWEGTIQGQMMHELARTWGIDLQQLIN